MPIRGSPGAVPSGAQLTSQPGREGFASAFKGKRQFRKLKPFGKEWRLRQMSFSLIFWLEVVKKLRLDTSKA